MVPECFPATYKRIFKMVKTREFEMRIELAGENNISLFRQMARRLASDIAGCKQVTGMVFLGGLARGFTDKYSDLDGMVFLERKNNVQEAQIRDMVAKEAKRSGIDIDLEVHLLKNFAKWKWTETSRWDFSHAKIAFDKKGRLRKTIEAKVNVPKEFWIKRIVQSAEYMKWYCCPIKESAGSVAETWIERGDLVSAHYCVNYGVDLILKTVFALNKEFKPPPKWRVFYFDNLSWLPKNHFILKKAMKIADQSANDLQRRLEAIRTIWTEVLSKIKEETGLDSAGINKYYVQKILLQRAPD